MCLFSMNCLLHFVWKHRLEEKNQFYEKLHAFSSQNILILYSQKIPPPSDFSSQFTTLPKQKKNNYRDSPIYSRLCVGFLAYICISRNRAKRSVTRIFTVTLKIDAEKTYWTEKCEEKIIIAIIILLLLRYVYRNHRKNRKGYWKK